MKNTYDIKSLWKHKNIKKTLLFTHFSFTIRVHIAFQPLRKYFVLFAAETNVVNEVAVLDILKNIQVYVFAKLLCGGRFTRLFLFIPILLTFDGTPRLTRTVVQLPQAEQPWIYMRHVRLR